MEYLLLVVIAVLGYWVYSLYTTNKKVTGMLSTLERELLELPESIHTGIHRDIVTREMLNDITGGDITRLGKVAKKAEIASTQHRQYVARIADLQQSTTDEVSDAK